MKVLIVEHDSKWQKLIELFLRPFNLDIEFSNNKSDALRLLHSNAYNFITLDLTLHNESLLFDGLSLLSELEESNQVIPVVVISGCPEINYIVEANNFKNVIHYVKKDDFGIPANKKTLAKVITNTINNLPSRQIGSMSIIPQADIDPINHISYEFHEILASYMFYMDSEKFSEYKEEQQNTIFKTILEAAKNSDLISKAAKSSACGLLLTGDGLAVVFTAAQFSLYPLLFAIEFQNTMINELRKFNFRIGLHSGNLSVYINPFGHYQFLGQALNDASRITDFGLANHILSSGDYYRGIVKPSSHVIVNTIQTKDLGSHTHPKGQTYSLFNYFADTYGNKSSTLRF